MKLGRKTGAHGDDQAATPGNKPDDPAADANAPAAGEQLGKARPRGKSAAGAAGSEGGGRIQTGTPGLAAPISGRSKPGQRKGSKRGYLDGQMLIAMPLMG